MKLKLLLYAFLLCSVSEVTAQDGQNLVALGNQAMNEGALRRAMEYYQAALAKEPQNGQIYTLYGYALHRQKLFSKADSVYRIALNLDSMNSKVHWYKGMNHVAMRQDSMAIQSYKRFLVLEKKRGGSLVNAYLNIGQCYERLLKNEGLYDWQLDDMIYHYEQVEYLDPSGVNSQLIRNFIETVKSRRPASFSGKWRMSP